MRGLVLLKWCEQLLHDRDERVAREPNGAVLARASRRAHATLEA